MVPSTHLPVGIWVSYFVSGPVKRTEPRRTADGFFGDHREMLVFGHPQLKLWRQRFEYVYLVAHLKVKKFISCWQLQKTFSTFEESMLLQVKVLRKLLYLLKLQTLKKVVNFIEFYNVQMNYIFNQTMNFSNLMFYFWFGLIF